MWTQPFNGWGRAIPARPQGEVLTDFTMDGFVRVDVFGNLGGSTWFWGCENASQMQGSFIVFHSQIILDTSNIQLVTDTYDLGEVVPPFAPYMGSFEGPGTLLPDSPFSRMITIIPEPSSVALLFAGTMLSGVFARHRKVKAGD